MQFMQHWNFAAPPSGINLTSNNNKGDTLLPSTWGDNSWDGSALDNRDTLTSGSRKHGHVTSVPGGVHAPHVPNNEKKMKRPKRKLNTLDEGAVFSEQHKRYKTQTDKDAALFTSPKLELKPMDLSAVNLSAANNSPMSKVSENKHGFDDTNRGIDKASQSKTLPSLLDDRNQSSESDAELRRAHDQEGAVEVVSVYRPEVIEVSDAPTDHDVVDLSLDLDQYEYDSWDTSIYSLVEDEKDRSSSFHSVTGSFSQHEIVPGASSSSDITHSYSSEISANDTIQRIPGNPTGMPSQAAPVVIPCPPVAQPAQTSVPATTVIAPVPHLPAKKQTPETGETESASHAGGSSSLYIKPSQTDKIGQSGFVSSSEVMAMKPSTSTKGITAAYATTTATKTNATMTASGLSAQRMTEAAVKPPPDYSSFVASKPATTMQFQPFRTLPAPPPPAVNFPKHQESSKPEQQNSYLKPGKLLASTGTAAAAPMQPPATPVQPPPMATAFFPETGIDYLPPSFAGTQSPVAVKRAQMSPPRVPASIFSGPMQTSSPKITQKQLPDPPRPATPPNKPKTLEDVFQERVDLVVRYHKENCSCKMDVNIRRIFW